MAVEHLAVAPARGLAPNVQRAVARVTEIGSLPEVTTRILEVVENPRATARQVHEVVRADPALAAKILKIVNSSFYGLPAQIGNLERAIVMLGLAALKNLALATSLIPFDVVVPADFESAKQAIVAVGKTTRPAYVRTGRPKVTGIYGSD